MHLRVNLKFLGAILVHPVRRQNFAGTGAPQILQHLRLCHIIKYSMENCKCSLLVLQAPVADVSLLWAIDWWEIISMITFPSSWSRFVDRCRTTNNMMGDCYCAAVVEALSRKVNIVKIIWAMMVKSHFRSLMQWTSWTRSSEWRRRRSWWGRPWGCTRVLPPRPTDRGWRSQRR